LDSESYSDDELHDINQVFVRVSKDGDLAIQHGLVLRDRMWDRLKRGEAPGGYRYDWLLEMAKAVIRMLGKEADNFDKAHPGDRASVEDLKDMLKFALTLLEKNANKGES
jgi:hypothetical protein